MAMMSDDWILLPPPPDDIIIPCVCGGLPEYFVVQVAIWDGEKRIAMENCYNALVRCNQQCGDSSSTMSIRLGDSLNECPWAKPAVYWNEAHRDAYELAHPEYWFERMGAERKSACCWELSVYRGTRIQLLSPPVFDEFVWTLFVGGEALGLQIGSQRDMRHFLAVLGKSDGQ